MGKKYRILLIDDEEDIRVFTKSMLEKKGNFQVETAALAYQGMELAKINKPDLILLDLVLPDLEGSEVAIALANDEATKDIPIVFLTGLAKEAEVELEAGKIGGRNFVSKPIDPKHLVERINLVLQASGR
ncbi:MAG: response regulator [Candidatus Omnitrophota bacterium]